MSFRAAMKALITGRVQGVGFRFFVQRQAIHYGLKGYVRNLPEGGVEVFAVGERGVLEAFLQDLKVGPPASEVDQCQVNWQVQPASYTGFSIQP